MFLQPFASYQAARTITLTLQSEMTANWNADEDDSTWTIPINFIVSELSSFGTFPASYQVGFGAFPVHPDADRPGKCAPQSSCCCRGVDSPKGQ